MKNICTSRKVCEVWMIKDRIIESLEYCRKNQKCSDCENCEYGGRSFLTCERLADDILVLLKEQEAVEPIVDSFLNRRCPKCNAVLKGKFCFECGQAVKWE